MKKLVYKNYKGSVEFSKKDNCYHGKLLNIDDLIMYEGSNLEELENYFKEAVNEYILDVKQKANTV